MSTRNRFLCTAAVAALSWVNSHAVPAFANIDPTIGSVQLTGSPGDYTITINGSGFGTSPVAPGYVGDTSDFRIADAAQLGFGEWGYTGDAETLTYQSWSNSQVVLSGFGGSPADAVALAIWNPSTGLGATWGGNVPPTTSTTPQITNVAFSGSGANTTITITGSGFGSSPFVSPFTGNLNDFQFLDFRTPSGGGSSLFGAGAASFGINPADSVTLDYQSWSNDQIVTGGFGGTYGESGATLATDDPVTITLWNSADSGAGGPQTAWGGTVTMPEPASLGSLFGGSILLLARRRARVR
jgi:hypothetical protein